MLTLTARTMYQSWRMKFEASSVFAVRDGILPPNCLNTPANTGMMNVSIAMTTPSAITLTTAG